MNSIIDTFASSQSEQRLAVSPAEAARMAGIGRTTLYAALGSGDLRSFKIGKRRLISVDALKQWLSAAESASSGESGHGR
ncbi:MAG: helix-turn-helix domain-containing protein [Rhodobacteraceae bacterium]|nr:helix-turn-helix domain-containing protein [Paracoccaceae bacterium]